MVTKRAQPRPIEHEVVELAAAVVVERERLVTVVREVVAADPVPRRTFGVDGGESAGAVLEDPERAQPRPIEHEVVELAAAVVVERERPVTVVRQVIAIYA